ncbi:MAG: DUF349 domain-containing protein [Draconibacterium sp.]|nr:DUF349 domain-containing protein [Draconibacterium sp.]
MEPKDLKNSKELKNSENPDIANSEKNNVSEETEKVENSSEIKEEKSADLEAKTVKDERVVEKPAKIKAEDAEEVKADETVSESKPQKPKAKKEEPIKAVVEEPSKEKTTEVTEDVKESPVEIKKTEVKVDTSAETDEKGKVVEKKVETEEKEPEEKAAVLKEISKEEKPEVVVAKSANEDETKEKENVVTQPERKIVEKKKEVVDYSAFTQIELVNALRELLDDDDKHDIKNEVEIIKSVFYKNLKANVEIAKKKFLEEEGIEEDFVVEEDPYENDIKDLLRRYRQIRIEFNRKMESEKENNLKLKYTVIENIKGLINSEESINKTFNDFRDLQYEWREIGLVPQSKMKNLWDTYHFHVENFYDYIKINRELRDLDLKKNLEIKIVLCENAEELLVEPSIIKAFNILQKYHERWREVGPVPREQKDDIWERFKAATSKINKKHQEYFESRKDEQKKNLEAKSALCEKVEDIDMSDVTNYRVWDEKSKELVELQKVWRTIGFAPKKDNNKIYERFRKGCDKFFDAKRDFYTKNKEIQQNNMQLKIDLCVQAEALKDVTDWKKTTQDFINIQKKWKEIGPIPRKHSDIIWKRFRLACDFFFDKKSDHFSGMDSDQSTNLKKKEELIEKVLNLKSIDDVDENLKSLKELQREWTEVGFVPFKKKDEIQAKFRDAINKLFDELNIDEDKRNILKFRSKMSSYSESNRGVSKMRMERDKYMMKLKQLENDHVLLDNNIGFFAKSKNAESLIADIRKKIEMSKQKIDLLKQKIRVIDDMDKE